MTSLKIGNESIIIDGLVGIIGDKLSTFENVFKYENSSIPIFSTRENVSNISLEDILEDRSILITNTNVLNSILYEALTNMEEDCRETLVPDLLTNFVKSNKLGSNQPLCIFQPEIGLPLSSVVPLVNYMMVLTEYYNLDIILTTNSSLIIEAIHKLSRIYKRRTSMLLLLKGNKLRIDLEGLNEYLVTPLNIFTGLESYERV